MDLETLKEKIQMALDSVENVPEIYQIEAFKIILQKLLENTLFEKPNAVSPNLLTVQPTGPISEPFQRLSQECQISPEQIKNLLDIENNEFIFVKPVDGNTDKQKQIIASKIILTANMRSLNLEWVGSNSLRGIIRKTGLGDDGNLAANLKSDPSFRIKGTGHKMQYSLTTTGWREGLDLIKNISED